MGKLTCSVMIGFLVLHLATVLFILATATPEWLKAEYNSTHGGNSSHNNTFPEISKGLWKICYDDNCTKLNQTIQEEWFQSVQGLDIVGVGLAVLALGLTYVMLIVPQMKDSGTAAVFSTAIQMISATSSLTALIIFAVRAKNSVMPEEIPEDYLVRFYWSFDVDIAGVVCIWIAALASIQSAYYYYNRTSGYENI